MKDAAMTKRAKVVVVGAGFGGLAVAKALGGKDVDVTLMNYTSPNSVELG